MPNLMPLETLSALSAHEAAAAFPYISDDEIMTLAQDIEANGLAQPIILFQNEILDGRNRLRALAKTKLTSVPVVEYAGTDPVGYVLSLNVHRRHMTTYDWVETAKKIAPLVAPGQGTRTDLASRDAKSAQSDEVGKTAKIVSDRLQGAVSQVTLERGWAIIDRRPELWEETKRTKGSIQAAFNQVPRKMQPKSVHGVQPRGAATLKSKLDVEYVTIKTALVSLKAAAPKFAKAYTAYMKSDPPTEETDDWGRRMTDLIAAIGLTTEVLDKA